MGYFYGLIGVPEGASWLRMTRVRGGIEPVRASRNHSPLPAAERILAAAPLPGVEGYDWYLFRIEGGAGCVVDGWISPEHRGSVFRLCYYDYSTTTYRATRVQEAFDSLSIPPAEGDRLVSKLREQGILLFQLECSPRFSRSPRVSGRKPLALMELTG